MERIIADAVKVSIDSQKEEITKSFMKKFVEETRPSHLTKTTVGDFKPFFEGLTDIQKGIFSQYLDHIDKESHKPFYEKLSKMNPKARLKYLQDFLDDSELKDVEEEIFKDTKTDSKTSHHEDLYTARKDSDPKGRLLLYQAMIKKLVDKEARVYMYEKCFRLDLVKLRETRKDNEVKFREAVYDGFIKYLNRMTQPQFKKLVDQVFDKKLSAKQIFKC